jgi:hypothetical protein
VAFGRGWLIHLTVWPGSRAASARGECNRERCLQAGHSLFHATLTGYETSPLVNRGLGMTPSAKRTIELAVIEAINWNELTTRTSTLSAADKDHARKKIQRYRSLLGRLKADEAELRP